MALEYVGKGTEGIRELGGGKKNNNTLGTVTGAVAGTLGNLMTSGSGGTTSSGRSSGSGSVGTAAATASGQSAADLAALYAQQERNRLLAAYDDTYQRSMQRIADAYNRTKGLYDENLNSTLGQIESSYDKSRSDITTDAERALREAYINSQMNKRDLQQAMSAQGLNGGAAESTMASMQNSYGRSRSGIEENRNTNLANLLQTRDQNIAAARQSYNQVLADLESQRSQLENQADQISANARMQIAMANLNALNANPSAYVSALQSLGTIRPDSSFTTGLQGLVANQGNFSFDPSQATNAYAPVSVSQAESIGTGSNYAKYVQQLQQQLNSGADSNAIKDGLFRQVQNGSMGMDDLASILRQLGLA